MTSVLFFRAISLSGRTHRDDPRPQPRPQLQPLPSAGGGLPTLGRPGQRGHQEGERIYGKNSPHILYSDLPVFKL